MGVRGLQTYLETLVQGGCRSIDIVNEAKKHAACCPPGTKPTIVVDGLCLIRWIYSKTNEFIFGGPWDYLVHEIMRLVRSFQKGGIDLVFFFDGWVCHAKVGAWRTRREQQTKEIMRTFEQLRAGCWTGGGNFTCPNGTAHTLCFIVRHLTSCKVYYTVQECDTEVCRYAECHPECFAILGQDSDFAIFNLRVLYLSCLHLDIDRLKTRAYSSEALARHLGLHRELLPLFACLAGNDTVSKEQLRSFHHTLGSAAYSYNRHAYLFEKIAALIRQKGWRAIPDIAVARCIGVDLDLLLKGVRMYSAKEECPELAVPFGIEPATWHLAFKMYKEAQMPPFVLQVLYGREIYLGETMEQPILNIPAHICFRSVRQRIYWILFRGDNSVIIREHVTYPGYIGIVDEAVPTASMHIQGGVPQLSHLWSPDPSLHLVRWRLFCGCLEMENQIQEISMLPPTYVVFCCVLHHLFRARIIEEPELHALILQCILPSGTKLELLKRRIPNSEINADLVSVSTCVMIGIQCVTMALCVCGKPSPVSSAAPWLCFDGKLFHLIHRDLSELQTSVPSLLHHDGDRLHLYSQLWNIVTSR